MSVPHPGGNPNANVYAQLKRDVPGRVPQIRHVKYVPDDIGARRLCAVFDSGRLDPLTAPKTPELGRAHFQFTTADGTARRSIAFEHGSPSLIFWEIGEVLPDEVYPNYHLPSDTNDTK